MQSVNCKKIHSGRLQTIKCPLSS